MRTSNIGHTSARRAVSWKSALALIAGAMLLTYCGIFLSTPPSQDPLLVCEVTLHNPSAQLEFGVEAVPDQKLTSRSGVFLDDDGTPRRLYYVNLRGAAGGNCPAGFAFPTVAAAAADWSLFIRQRIDGVFDDPNSSSILSIWHEEWCAVPGSLSCTALQQPVGECTARVPLINTVPLATCVLPEPQACLEIRCGTGTSCTEIDFGEVPVGGNQSRTVTLANCEADSGSAVQVTLDGDIDPLNALSEFDIAVAENTCHPVNGDNESLTLAPGTSCTFSAVFAPRNPGANRGRTLFTSSAQTGTHNIELLGTALGGTLSYTVPDLLPDPTQIPDELCVDDLVDGNCTAARDLVAENAGPGTVSLDARLQNNEGFEFTATGEQEFQTELAAGGFASLEFRWCGAANDSGQANLVADSNTEVPTFARNLIRDPDGCTAGGPGPVCGNGIIDPGEQCDDGNTSVDGNACLADCTIDPTLIAAYGFEGSDPATAGDVTGNGHDGSLMNGAIKAVGQTGFGNAAEFDGSDDFISIPDDAALDLTNGIFTIAALIRPESFGENRAGIIDHGGANGGTTPDAGWALMLEDNGNQVELWINGFRLQSNADIVAPGEWQHVAVTRDAQGEVVFFKDGVQVGVIANSDAPSDQADTVSIGNRIGGTARTFDGLIDEVRIYNRALTDVEIQQIANTPLTALSP